MKKFYIACLSALLLNACASHKLEQDQIESNAEQQALETSMSSEEAMLQAQSLLNDALSHQLDYYTPLHFKSAKKALFEMETLQKSNNSSKDVQILEEYFKLLGTIEQAKLTKESVQQRLAKALKQRATLSELGVKNVLPADYQAIEKSLSSLFELIETNQSEKALKEQIELVDEMVALEIKTLLLLHIGPAQNILEKAEENDADDYAEATFEQAERSIETSTQLIRSHYQDREKVAQAGELSLIAAQRAYHIGVESKSMVDLNEEEAEAKALEFEALIKSIRDAMGAKGLEGLSIQEQIRKIAQLAQQRKAEETEPEQ